MQTMTRKTVRAGTAVLSVMLALAGCSWNLFEAEENEAVLDFIAASELTEVEQFRYFQQFSYNYVSDQYVTIPTYAGDYLVEFSRPCPELRQMRITPDMIDTRHDNRTIRARFDTIRGCRIGKIYEITEAQAAELEELGDAPGDEIYLPEDAAPRETSGDEKSGDEKSGDEKSGDRNAASETPVDTSPEQ